MYNIIDQQNHSTGGSRSSSMLNETSKPIITTTSAGYKIDCAKECPCGVPVIPVPDQWLEVMVTGGFKVWHIIFIIIAFLVTIVVVYCCFHRCRIPRTKQEIEADLMRSNLTNKFSDYLQEFPNEPTTFLEALKRVQELEEKSEQDDPGARKRKGWLKRMGKERQAGEKPGEGGAKEGAIVPDEQVATEPAGVDEVKANASEGAPPSEIKTSKEEWDAELSRQDPAPPPAADDKPQAKNDPEILPKHKAKKALKSKRALGKADGPRQDSKQETPSGKDKTSKTKSEGQSGLSQPPALLEAPAAPAALAAPAANKSQVESGDGALAATTGRPAKIRKKRDKPNLSRTKAAHVGSRGESSENHNVLTIPVASHHGHGHHHRDQRDHRDHGPPNDHQSTDQPHPPTRDTHEQAPVVAGPGLARRRARSKTKEPKDSTVVQIESSPPPTSKSKRDKK